MFFFTGNQFIPSLISESQMSATAEMMDLFLHNNVTEDQKLQQGIHLKKLTFLNLVIIKHHQIYTNNTNIEIFYNNYLSQILVQQQTPIGKALNYDGSECITNEGCKKFDVTHTALMQSHTNGLVEQTTLHNGLDYDQRQYQTIDKGNKTLILYIPII